MNLLSVNGIQTPLPVAPESPFQELIHYLRNNLTTESALITSVRVNGTELNDLEEEKLAAVPISSLESIEIFTLHPREIAQETLTDLLTFTNALETLSQDTSKLCNSKVEFIQSLTQLLDGISAFTEGLTHSKRVLKLQASQNFRIAEADLLSILKDLLAYHEKGQVDYMAELLDRHLPENFREWRTQILPELIRSRDC